MKSYKLFISLAALLGLLAVIIGSLAAHAIDKGLTPEALERIYTAQEYQFYHVAALLSVGILGSLHRNQTSVLLKLAGLFFLLGILLFSGSLYAYALTGNALYGSVTPFGGISFILGWFFLMIFGISK
ncbi:DUF423 domain-containing protein [uncultured Cocleimonas sp.]|uniref:DUF423 domain-containing protein n=1 Tax=uncultured Cocleimonas sp. TaxID=1051587 RepID=UPI002621C1AD|nr:DUF423 domain-containing protein [uncultured Cocleimonas sp.]